MNHPRFGLIEICHEVLYSFVYLCEYDINYNILACALCSDGTKFDPIGFAVVAVFYLIILFSGIFAARLNKSGSSDDMVLAGRNLSGFKGVLTMIATWVCGGYLYGTTQGVVTKGTGLAWTQAPWCYAVCFFVGALLFAKKMREAEYVTMMDPLKKKFGRVMNSLLYLPTVLGDIFWIGMGLATLGAALSTVIGISPNVAIIVSGAFAAIYTFIGGLYAVAFADVIQLIMMLFCLYLAVPFVLTSDRVSNPIHTKDIWQGSIAAEDAGVWLDSAILMILGGIPWQVYFQRILACRTVKDAKILSYLSGFGAFIAAVPAAIIGVWGTTVNWSVIPEVVTLDGKESYALSYILQYCTPKVITYLSLGGIAAATMSTADGALLASSTVFCYNIYRPLFHRNAGDREMIWVTRIGVFVVCIIGCILAIVSDDVYSLWVLTSDFIFVLLFPQLLLVLYYPRVNTYGSFCAFVIGLFLRIAGGEATLKLPALIDFGKAPFRLIAMVTSLILMIIVSEITRYIIITKSKTDWDFINYYSNHSENECETGNNNSESLKTLQVEMPKLESPSDKSNNSLNSNSNSCLDDNEGTSCVIDPQIMVERHEMSRQKMIEHSMQLNRSKRGIKA